MDIGTSRQLFIDNRFFESSENVKLCMNPPIQHPEILLTGDKAWEALGISAYNTVFREEDGRFRMWYGAMMKSGLPQEGAIRLGYAESEDGLHWEKPVLGLIPFQGSKENNLVAPNLGGQSMQGGTIYRDERAPQAERYKLWSKFQPTNKQISKGILPGLWTMYSADGIHWEVPEGQPNPADQMCDTQNMFFWDDRLEEYVGYTRVKETQRLDEAAEASGKGRYRSIGRITSPDFQNWSKTQIVLEADAEELAIPVPYQRDDARPNLDIYTSCAMKIPDVQDVYFMMPSVFYHWGDNDFPATMDIKLMASRDGISWKRCGNRQPFLRNGLDGSASSGMVFANPWLIPMDNELWFYYTGRGHTHAEDRKDQKKNGVFRATLRRDGFISADVGYSGGTFTTPPLRFEGKRLELNLDGSAGGWLQAELQDEQGQPLPGYKLEEADTLMGNAISKPVTWKGSDDLGKLAGQTVRLRIVMRDMKLYAFQFFTGEK